MTKKLFIIVVLYLFVAIAAQAQIQRSFFGATLGETVYEDALKALKQSRVSKEAVEENADEEGGMPFLLLSNVTFEGVTYASVLLEFQNNTFMRITFAYEMENAKDLKEYDATKKRIQSICKDYEPTMDPSVPAYSDGSTVVEVEDPVEDEGLYSWSLTYTWGTFDVLTAEGIEYD